MHLVLGFPVDRRRSLGVLPSVLRRIALMFYSGLLVPVLFAIYGGLCLIEFARKGSTRAVLTEPSR